MKRVDGREGGYDWSLVQGGREWREREGMRDTY